MKYLLMIYDAEKRNEAGHDPKESEGYVTFGKEFGASILAGNALQPTKTATSVRLRGGKRLLTDGPFAETKEQLGGFYVVEAKDLDAAIQMAAQIPAAATGTIEIRPIQAM